MKEIRCYYCNRKMQNGEKVYTPVEDIPANSQRFIKVDPNRVVCKECSEKELQDKLAKIGNQ